MMPSIIGYANLMQKATSPKVKVDDKIVTEVANLINSVDTKDHPNAIPEVLIDYIQNNESQKYSELLASVSKAIDISILDIVIRARTKRIISRSLKEEIDKLFL